MKEIKIEKVVFFWEFPQGHFGLIYKQVDGDGRIIILPDQTRMAEFVFELTGSVMTRPHSVDLARNVLESLNGVVKEVIVRLGNEDQNFTYRSDLVVESPNGKKFVDARPTDALLLALKRNAPVYADSDCFGALNGPLSGRAPSSLIWPFEQAALSAWMGPLADKREAARRARAVQA